MGYEIITEDIRMPEWFGDKVFHATHRSNLLRKDSEYYSKFRWKESSDAPYVWLDPQREQWFFIDGVSKKRVYI